MLMREKTCVIPISDDTQWHSFTSNTIISIKVKQREMIAKQNGQTHNKSNDK